MYRIKRYMKKLILVFISLIIIGKISPVFAQGYNPYIDFFKKFYEATGHGTNCSDSKKDKNGQCNPACCKTNEDCQSNGPDQSCTIQNGECSSGNSCFNPHDPTQACVNEGKKDKYGNYNPACCLADTDCPGDQPCSIGNNFCKSGNSCDPNGHRTSTTQPSTPSNGGSPNNSPNPGTSTGKYKTSLDDFPFYCQGDNDWQKLSNNTYTGINGAGCAPTSFAMIITKFGLPMTPIEVDNKFVSEGWRQRLNGASRVWGGALASNWFQKELGFKIGPNLVYGGRLDINQAQQALQEGNLIIASSARFPCGAGCVSPGTPIDHVFVIDKVDNNMVRVRDPSNCQWFSGEESLAQQYLYRPPNQIDFFAFPVKKLN